MKKGFVSAGIIYTLLVIFLILTFTTLSTMQNKKTVLDNLKEETVNALYCNQNTINELKNQIKELQKIITTKNNEISNLKNMGNATASQILSGKTALVKGKEITGTMNNINGNISVKSILVASDLIKFQINTPGYYDTNDYLYVNNSTLASKIGLTASQILKGKTVLGISGTATSDVNATASQILSGKTAYVNGSKITGTMANKSGSTVNATTVTESGTNALITMPSNGYYSTSSKISVPIETIKNNVSSLNMSAAKTEGAKEALSKMKSVRLPYTVPSDGVICVNLSMTVTNHDNSAGGSMWCSLLKNGSTVKSSSTSISGWSGGSCSIQVVLQVSAGDVISYSSGYQLEYDFYLGTSITSTAVYAPLE